MSRKSVSSSSLLRVRLSSVAGLSSFKVFVSASLGWGDQRQPGATKCSQWEP